MPTYVRSAGAWLSVSGSTAGSTIPSGSLMLFQQTAAPTGWTKQTTHNDKSLRVVSGNAGSGGSTAFTSVFTNRGVPLAQHAHSGSTGGHSVDHSHGGVITTNIYDAVQGEDGPAGAIAGAAREGENDETRVYLPGNTGGTSTNHSHSFTTDNAGTAGASMDFAVQYVDLIIASKN